MSATVTVSSLTQQCLDKLHKAMTGKIATENQNHLESRLGGFNLWVDNVGATAKSGASLDSRFRSRPDDLDLVKNILSLLSDFLDEYMDIVDKRLPIAEALVNIDSAIRNLAKIGVAIRRTGKASRNRRANKLFNPDEHHEFKRHLECLVLLRPNESIPAGSSENNDTIRTKLEQLVKTRMEDIDSSKLNEIQKRLIDANLRRRHNFLLAQKRSQRVKKAAQPKSTADKQQPDVAPPKVSEITPTAHVVDQAKIPASLEPRDQPKKIKAPPTVTDYTIASTAEGTLQSNPARNQHRAPTIARSQISFIAANTEFPKPPSSSQNELVFKCPCCCQSLPSEDFTSSSRWRQHLIEDLCPYTCIAQSCPTPDMLFTTRKAWELHVENDHPPQWQCLLCDEDDEPFSSEEDITTHTQTQHNKALSKYELSFLLSSAEVRYIGIESCPLCSSHGPRESPELVDHAVRHAYEFALRALPWPQPVIEDLNKPIGTYSLPQNTTNSELFEKWLESVDCSTEKLSISSFDEMDHAAKENVDDTPAEDYFTTNDYFEDEESADSSKRQTAPARSALTWSESSDRNLANQNNWDDTTQTGIDLIAAAARGDEDTVRSLVEDYLNFDSDGEIKKRTLIAAVQGGHIAVVEQLLESGVDIDSRDEKGWTALFFAIEQNNITMTHHLIESGIDVNIKDDDGLTALHIATLTGDGEIISALFSTNTYQGFRDYQIQKAISWAQVQGHLSAAEMLKKESILNRAQKTFNIKDRTTAARSIIHGNGWHALIDPLLDPVYFDLVDTLQHKNAVWSVAFSHDGKYFATGCSDGSARIFDVETRQNVWYLDLRQNEWVHGVCFSPDGRSLATVCGNLVQVWDIATKTLQNSFLHEEAVLAIDASNDGRLLASGDFRGNTHVWDLEQGVEIQTFSMNKYLIRSVKISPDSRFVAAVCEYGDAHIWNLKTDASEGRVLRHGEESLSIALSSDGKYLVTGGDSDVKLWELGTGTCLSKFRDSESRVYSLSMAPDDRWIAAASQDGSVRFWDRNTQKSHCIFEAHNDFINTVAFSPLGGYFATASDDKTVRIWSYGPHR